MLCGVEDVITWGRADNGTEVRGGDKQVMMGAGLLGT